MVWCRHPQGCHRQRGRLKPTWAPQGAIQCRIAVTAMSCGQTPRRRHDGPHRIRWRLREQTARRLPRGFLWPRGNRGTPRYSMTPSRGAWRCKRGRGRSLPGRADEPQRWQARRAETGLAATVGYRHAAAAALDGKRKGVKGTLAALAAAPPVSRKRVPVVRAEKSFYTNMLKDNRSVWLPLPFARRGNALGARFQPDSGSPGIAGPGGWMASPITAIHDPTPASIRCRERHRCHRVNALARVLRWRCGPGG